MDGISFEVYRGEIFGMVGPNGAGKTTTIECVERLRRPDGGSIQVLGLDPLQDRYRVRERIGVQFQSAALPSPWDLFGGPVAGLWVILLLGHERQPVSGKSLKNETGAKCPQSYPTFALGS